MHAYLLSLLLATGVVSAEVNTLEGEFVRGEIVDLNENALVLRDDDQELREVSRESLLQVVASAEPATMSGPITLVLVDGTRIYAEAFTSQQGVAHVQLSGGRNIEFPSEQVSLVRFWPATASQQAGWRRILEMELSGDVLILRRETESLDYLDGIAGDVTADVVGFTFEDNEYSANRQRVEGIRYSLPAAPDLPPLVCVVEDLDGSRWQAAQILMQNDAWELTTRTGIEMSIPVDQTRLLDFSNDKLVYLSSLEPIRQSWSPFLQTAFPLLEQRYTPRFDESLDGGPLRLLVERDGVEEELSFPRGIALHSRSELVYRLPAGFRRFQALAGIDERVRPHGSVWLEIIGDDRTLYEGEISATGEDGSAVTAVPLDLDIEGVSRLTIRVGFGEGQDVGDHLDLANAQIRK